MMLHGIAGTRFPIHEDDGSMMDEHSSEVRSSAWREPFTLPIGSMHLENDKENDVIGNKDDG